MKDWNTDANALLPGARNGPMATPPSRPSSRVPPATTKAFRTPGSDFSSSTFAVATLPPKTGHFS